jgi:hypothetical protein
MRGPCRGRSFRGRPNRPVSVLQNAEGGPAASHARDCTVPQMRRGGCARPLESRSHHGLRGVAGDEKLGGRAPLGRSPGVRRDGRQSPAFNSPPMYQMRTSMAGVVGGTQPREHACSRKSRHPTGPRLIISPDARRDLYFQRCANDHCSDLAIFAFPDSQSDCGLS